MEVGGGGGACSTSTPATSCMEVGRVGGGGRKHEHGTAGSPARISLGHENFDSYRLIIKWMLQLTRKLSLSVGAYDAERGCKSVAKYGAGDLA